MARPGPSQLGGKDSAQTVTVRGNVAPMRIAIFQKRYHANSRFIVKGLQDRGHQVGMYVFDKGNVAEDYALIEPVLIPYGYLTGTTLRRFVQRRYVNKLAVPSLRGMWRELSAFAPDVVILKKNRMPNFVAGIMARLLGARLVLLTDWPPPSAPAALALHNLQKRLGILPRNHICTTAFTPGALSRSDIRGAVFRPYPIDLPAPMPKAGSPDILNLMMVGKYGSDRKRLDWLVEAAARAGLDPARTRITIVGAGKPTSDNARKVEQTARRLGWDGSVTLLFNQPLVDMPALYAAQDIFVMTAEDEPFGAVVIEAMAQGLPVISNPSVGASDCVVPDETGLIYPAHDLDALAACLRRLADDPALRQRMGQAGRRLLAQSASPDAFARLIEEIADMPASGMTTAAVI